VIETFDRDGFCVVPSVLEKHTVTDLIAVLERANVTRSKRGEDVFGARNLLLVPEIRDLANSSALTTLVREVLRSDAMVVRGIFFDKTPAANWPVAWHQDLMLAVGARRDIPQWTNWTLKGGLHHVNPPVAVLQNMVTLRVMLDDCDSDNGPLRVLSGSHLLGRLSREEIVGCCGSGIAQECLCEAGSVVMMRPLLLHASSAAGKPLHRRVVHLEYAAANAIPKDLVWTRVPGKK
jgi:ectoine hydroxylase-related dioxygenase (phytanoyl-CoA dioxygenase family)